MNITKYSYLRKSWSEDFKEKVLDKYWKKECKHENDYVGFRR